MNSGGIFPSSSLVCPFCPPALSTPSSTFLHPSFHGCCFRCFFHPWQSSLQHCSPAQTPKLPVPQSRSCPGVLTPAQLQQRPLFPPVSLPSGSAVLFPSSVISSPSLLSSIYFSKISHFCSRFWQGRIHCSTPGPGLPAVLQAQGSCRICSALC